MKTSIHNDKTVPIQFAPHDNHDTSIYAIGVIQPSFPTLNLEKQYEAAALSIKANPEEFYKVFNYRVTMDSQPQLSYRPFLYLAQQATWVLTINLVDTYILEPDTPTQLNALINTTEQKNTYVVIGELTGEHAAQQYDDIALPTATVKHLIAVTDIQVPILKDGKPANQQLELPALKPTIGLTKKDRASNYFLSHFYQIVVDSNQHLLIDDIQAIQLQHIHSEPMRHVVEFILCSSDRSRYACNIDVTNHYPFVSSRLAPFAKSI